MLQEQLKRSPSKEFTVLMVHSICLHLHLTCGRDLVLLVPNEANVALCHSASQTHLVKLLWLLLFFPEGKNVIKWHLAIWLGWLSMYQALLYISSQSYLNSKLNAKRKLRKII